VGDLVDVHNLVDKWSTGTILDIIEGKTENEKRVHIIYKVYDLPD